MAFHVVEVAVIVEQRQIVVETKRADHHICHLSDRDPALSKVPIVPRGPDCCVWIQHGKHVVCPEQSLDEGGTRVCHTLQDF